MGLSVLRSMAHATFAISSRRKWTSSVGALSSVRLSVGARKKRFVMTLVELPRAGSAFCHIEKYGAGNAGSPIGRSRLRTPKVSVTTSESTRVTEPTGKAIGITNQD